MCPSPLFAACAALQDARLPEALLHIQQATRAHQASHGCTAHTFEDGAGLFGLVRQHRPQRILELGTGLGYTAALMALACPQAHIDTLEGDATHAHWARQHVARCLAQAAGLDAGQDAAPCPQRVRIHEGSFSVTLPALGLTAQSVDLVFFDGNMPPFSLVQYAHDVLRPHGLFVCANLELNGPQGGQRAKAALRNPQHWTLLPPLEQGKTWVAQKVPAQHRPL